MLDYNFVTSVRVRIITLVNARRRIKINNMTKFDEPYREFKAYLDITSSYFKVDKSKVLTCNEEDCVNARYCLIYLLCEKYRDNDIVRISGLSKSCVNKIRNNTRIKLGDYYFRNYLKDIKALAFSK